MSETKRRLITLWAVLVALAACAPRAARDAASDGADAGAEAPIAELEAAATRHPLKEAYFGEQHVHTSYSLDAYIGGTRLTPFDAYEFARGAEKEVNGVLHRLDRPLDWAAVTDHAEYIGEMYTTWTEDAPGHDDPLVEELRGLTDLAERQAWFLEYVVSNNRGDDPRHPEFYQGPESMRSAWREVIVAAAEENYRPGEFTTFIAFEWSAAPGGANLHRNVVFRGSDVPDLPVSTYEIRREDALWDWMEARQAEGMRLMAIPHNSNASKGVLFGATTDNEGRPFDRAYAERRARLEPLVEMMQVKGSSEVHRGFWPADEFADFENADSIAKFSGRTAQRNNYVRWGLIEGLAWERQLGANPFRYGFAGGTDNHNGLPAETMEAGPNGEGWEGAHGLEDGTAERRRDGEVGGWLEAIDENPGALTGVWAESNTRGAIWDAMAARETFATSGTRMKVRLFGGDALPADPPDGKALVEQGYADGVPMGGTLEGLTGAPTFTVWALKDPTGANLDRIQIVKGWVDADGSHHERIVDVAWSDDRAPGPDGELSPVGNTVDVETARYRNDIGSVELMGAWTDAEFDPARPAVYYLRALEIPTPRWSTIDAVSNGLPLPENVPPTIQERAWSSPIWYAPPGGSGPPTPRSQ